MKLSHGLNLARCTNIRRGGTVHNLTICPVAADFSAARQARTASRDSSAVMTAGFVPVATQLAK